MYERIFCVSNRRKEKKKEKKNRHVFLRSSRDDRTMDLHSLPAIMELLSIISIITHNGLGGLFVPPLQKAATEARHVTRASEHSLFATYMVQSDPGPHYRKMSKLLVLLQLRFQT